jgi:hypothetical protein
MLLLTAALPSATIPQTGNSHRVSKARDKNIQFVPAGWPLGTSAGNTFIPMLRFERELAWRGTDIRGV